MEVSPLLCESPVWFEWGRDNAKNVWKSKGEGGKGTRNYARVGGFMNWMSKNRKGSLFPFTCGGYP